MHVPSTVEQRLRSEAIIWMTTVTPSGLPQTSPIWFWWNNGGILMFSKDDTARIRNVMANPRVSLNLDGDGLGGAVVVIEATARIDRTHPPASEMPAYIAKYQRFLDEYEWTPESFSRDYPVPVLITPARLRSW